MLKLMSTALASTIAFGAFAFDASQPVYEIAIQEVKPGHEADWSKIRHGLVGYLQTLDTVEADWTVRSQFSLPTPPENQVYIGLTRWSSLDAFQAVAEPFSQTEDWAAFTANVNFLGYVQAQPIDGEPFVLEDYLTEGDEFVEVAIRSPKEGMEEEFEATREAFFAKVAEQKGYLFHEEMENADGTRSVIIGWDSKDDFEQALGALSQMAEMGAFFGTVDVVAYQAGLVSTDW